MTRRGDRADLEAANLEERVVLEYEVVPGQHGSVGRRHRHLIPRIAYRRHGLDVVPVAVRLDHSPDPEVAAQLQEPFVLVGGIDEQCVAGLAAPHDVDVVVHRSDDDPVHLDGAVPVVDEGLGHDSHLLVAA
jgi:hypothetical protein